MNSQSVLTSQQAKPLSERLGATIDCWRRYADGGRAVGAIAFEQARANNRRLLSTMQHLSNATDAAEASAACTAFLTDMSRTNAEYVAALGKIAFGAYEDTWRPLLGLIASAPPIEAARA